jgi:hypothetical protein
MQQVPMIWEQNCLTTWVLLFINHIHTEYSGNAHNAHPIEWNVWKNAYSHIMKIEKKGSNECHLLCRLVYRHQPNESLYVRFYCPWSSITYRYFTSRRLSCILITLAVASLGNVTCKPCKVFCDNQDNCILL